jgi:cytidylate kinase
MTGQSVTAGGAGESSAPAAGRQRVLTVSATYGAGGSVVAPALAERLGVPFLERVTNPARDLAQHPRARERLSDAERRTTPAHRLIACLTHAMPAGPTLSPPSTQRQHHDQRRDGEAELQRFVAAGDGVVLGHAAAVVLGKQRGFHVRLDGPVDARVAQGARIERISADEARGHMRAADAARAAYVERLYRVDPADSTLYHLVLDSTAVALETVIELILTAAAVAAR